MPERETYSLHRRPKSPRIVLHVRMRMSIIRLLHLGWMGCHRTRRWLYLTDHLSSKEQVKDDEPIRPSPTGVTEGPFLPKDLRGADVDIFVFRGEAGASKKPPGFYTQSRSMACEYESHRHP